MKRYYECYTLPAQKSHTTLILCWTAFSFDYDTYLSQYRHSFGQHLQCYDIYSLPELHTFFPKSCTDDDKVFSSTSSRLSMGLRSGPCGGQSVYENYVSCSLNYSFGQRILELSSWNMPMPSGKKKIHWWNNLVIHYIQVAEIILWAHNVAEPRPDQLQQHLISPNV